MSTLQVTSYHAIQPVAEATDSRQHLLGGGPSEELIGISGRLRDSLEGLSAWIQIHVLLRDDSDDSLQASAKELNHLNKIFLNAHDELLSYAQQVPELTDSPAAYDMLQMIEACFFEDLAHETGAEVPLHGFTSWSQLLLFPKEIHWTADLLTPLFAQVSNASWKAARQILSATKIKLL